MNVARALPILMYHHVSPSPGLVTVSPGAFRAHIAALAQAGWRTLGADGIERFFRGEPVPAKTCVITFDDGYLDNYVHAHPVLAEFGMKALLFVVTGWLGDGPARHGPQSTPSHDACKRCIAAGDADSVMLRWSEVEVMVAAGSFEFHTHTHTHTRWDLAIADRQQRCAELAQDLDLSRTVLARRLGQVSRHLCWPQGYYDADYVKVAGEHGFDYLYTTEKRVNVPTGSTRHIGRIVTKERSGGWCRRRVALFASPYLGHLYAWWRR